MFEETFDAIYHIATFQRYTNMPRAFEIAYGVLWWFCVTIIAYSVTYYFR